MFQLYTKIARGKVRMINDFRGSRCFSYTRIGYLRRSFINRLKDIYVSENGFIPLVLKL